MFRGGLQISSSRMGHQLYMELPHHPTPSPPPPGCEYICITQGARRDGARDMADVLAALVIFGELHIDRMNHVSECPFSQLDLIPTQDLVDFNRDAFNIPFIETENHDNHSRFPLYLQHPKQSCAIYPILFQCWPNVFDAGPALKYHWVFAWTAMRVTHCSSGSQKCLI